MSAPWNPKLEECRVYLQHEVMVTAGANQAFTNVVLTLPDPGDRIVLFVPYYFNHLMAVQMTGGAADVVHGRCDPQTWHPDLDWLEQELSQPDAPKMVVLVNPCNPTGVESAVHRYGHASKAERLMCRFRNE